MRQKRKTISGDIKVGSSLTFREHLRELKVRLIYITISIGFWSAMTYLYEQKTINALLKPARHQQFIYTSPIGGVDFVFRVSLYIAVILSIPVITYNLLAFLQPLLSRTSKRLVAFGAICSGTLAALGLAFGYFIGLPSAMHFLLHQFVTSQIKPLLTIQSYLGFVMVYMLGSALMLQMPLIIIFINRIKPLKPKRLLHYERWVILGSFIASGIMNPSPNILEQLLVAGPLIGMYQISIFAVVIMNRKLKIKSVEEVPQPHLQPMALAVAEPEPVYAASKLVARPRPVRRPQPQSMDFLIGQPKAAPITSQPPKPVTQNVIKPSVSKSRNIDSLIISEPRPRKYIDSFLERRGDSMLLT